MMAKKLVYKLSKSAVVVGDKVASAFGDDRDIPMVVTGWQEPLHSASTGRVYVKVEDSRTEGAYFPGVFGLEFVEVDNG